jgi:hypothetical protein
MDADKLCEAVKAQLQNGELAKEFAEIDHFSESVNLRQKGPVYGIDEVRIAYGGSEGVWATFFGTVGEDDTASVFVLKTLDDSAAGFNSVCRLSGEVVSLCEKILAEESDQKMVITSLSDAVNDIFFKLQKKKGIQGGDISPEDSLILESRKNALLGTIMDVVSKQAS